MRGSWKGIVKNKRINPFHRVVYLLSTKKRVILFLMMLFMIMVVGCKRETRHKILTFFFEGVPPLDSESQTDESEMAIDELAQSAVTKEKPVSRISKQSHSSKHNSVRDCSKCHIGAMGSGQRQLVKPIPDLCYSCHTNYSAAGGYLHGPIAVGECVFCHDSHQSKYVYL